jgi:Holliday junction resolvasome RuvABC endonuclease subunit
MKIVSVDHGASTGFCYMVDGKPVTYGILKIEGDTTGEKLYNFYKKIHSLFDSFKPDLVAMEMPNHTKNAHTTRLLSGYYAFLHSLSYEFMATPKEVHPTSLKKVIAGNGKAEKLDVAIAVAKEYDLPLDSILTYDFYKVGYKKGQIKKTHYDVTDAIALASYVWKVCGN